MSPSIKTPVPLRVAPPSRVPHGLRSLLVVSSVLLATLGGTGVALAQQSTIGLKLGVQPWTPLTNNDTVQFPLNNPSLISDELNKGWQNYSDLLKTTITAELGTADLVASGVTFYKIDLTLTQPVLSIDQLKGSGTPGDPYQVALHIDLKNEGVEMSATTPGGLDRSLDPRCNANFDATLRLDLTIANTPGAAFSSPQTQPGSEPLAQITRFDFGAKNDICGIAVDALTISGFKDKITSLVTQPDGVANKPLGDAARTMLTTAVADLNNVVSTYQRPDINMAILRAWLVDQGGAKTIVLNLAPQAPLPDPTAGLGSMGGALTITNAGTLKTGTNNGAVVCSQLPVTVSRITGPRPMISPTGTLGDEPLEPLAVKASCNGGSLLPGHQATYQITGMSALFPQIVTFGSVPGHCEAKAGIQNGIDVQTPNWQEGVIMAQTLSQKHDLTATYLTVVCGGEAARQPDPRDRFLKYLLDQEAANPNEATLNILTQYVNSRGLSQEILQNLPAVQLPTQHSTAMPVPPSCTPNRYIADGTTARINRTASVHAGDSMTCPVVGQLRSGEAVEILSCTLANGSPSDWCKIAFGSSGAGYVAKRLLAFSYDGPHGHQTTLPSRLPPTNYDHPSTVGDGLPTELQLGQANPDDGCIYVRQRMICSTTLQ